MLTAQLLYNVSRQAERAPEWRQTNDLPARSNAHWNSNILQPLLLPSPPPSVPSWWLRALDQSFVIGRNAFFKVLTFDHVCRHPSHLFVDRGTHSSKNIRVKVKLFNHFVLTLIPQVAGACSERQKMFHGGSFLKLADDNMDIQNPEAQNREMSGFWENQVWKFYIIGI